MPRSQHPVDGVLNYFEGAPIEAAEIALHLARRAVRRRKATGDTAGELVRRQHRKSSEKGEKKDKPTKAVSQTEEVLTSK